MTSLSLAKKKIIHPSIIPLILAHGAITLPSSVQFNIVITTANILSFIFSSLFPPPVFPSTREPEAATRRAKHMKWQQYCETHRKVYFFSVQTQSAENIQEFPKSPSHPSTSASHTKTLPDLIHFHLIRRTVNIFTSISSVKVIGKKPFSRAHKRRGKKILLSSTVAPFNQPPVGCVKRVVVHSISVSLAGQTFSCDFPCLRTLCTLSEDN